MLNASAGVIDVVLGVDLGTTATKVVAFDVHGQEHASSSAGYPLLEPSPGEAVQDPAEITAAALRAIRAVTAELPPGAVVRAVSFSSALHSLVGVDADGVALTPSITWADIRANKQADRLRTSGKGLELQLRTGTPTHPMSPLTKLMWFREEDPELHARVATWAGIKEVVVHALTGEWVTDHSVASATGLFNLRSRSWDREALELAGVGPERLPRLVATTYAGLRPLPAVAAELGLPADVPLVVGGGDGPLANLGIGAVKPGVAACSVGTSGALRVVVESPSVDPQGRVFCYALTEDRWAVGGAITNGGVAVRWAGDTMAPELEELAPELGDSPVEPVLDLAASVPPGCGGLVMLPYLLSERAPHWTSVPSAAYVGLTRAHGRAHLVRATLEGICQQLALVLDSMRAAGNEVHEVRATGGVFASRLWRQTLADVLGMPVSFAKGHEGSSFGAALLGMQAVGLVESVDAAEALIEIEEVVAPDPAAVSVYATLRPLYSEVYAALLPAFARIRELEESLPLAYSEPAEPQELAED
ncbi:gluconokinase [Motilibacter sp. E257]|uniref:Gluconokinase n=1 Tax=Motilibacter deserti TaxID=2714956 RepID=A0ABX0GZ08_9ACTN|nr:gluconokinase [Motilibacter deserti]